ncbi:hypothetical protein RI367_003831 [Sorochytrium milnesiophthora]
MTKDAWFVQAAQSCSVRSSSAGTYQLSRRGLSSEQQEVSDVFCEAIAVANDAAQERGDGSVQVAVALGSYGAILLGGAEFTGDYVDSMPFDHLVDFHVERLQAVYTAVDQARRSGQRVDWLAFETVPAVAEARAIVQALDTVWQDVQRVQAWVSFSCKSDAETCHGEPIEQAVDVLSRSSRISAIGINCTSPHFVLPLVQKIKSRLAAGSSNMQVFVYPNRGGHWVSDERTWRADKTFTDNDYVTMAATWQQAGADGIGGCCRTTPELMLALSALKT